MIEIAGTRRSGLGDATKNLADQLPWIVREFPEVSQCHLGTINLELDSPLLVLSPDHRSRPIPWAPQFPQGEVFEFVRIELESPIGGRAVAAWLYIAHNAPHRRDPSIHEVLSPWVEIEAQARCLIRIRRSHVQIPYPNFPAIIVL